MRSVIIGRPEVNAHLGFPSNQVRTAHYSSTRDLLTRGLVQCIVRSISSCYFFIVGLLQLLTPWSPTGRLSTMGPYAGNKLFELFNLHLDNNKRLANDLTVNSRKYLVACNDVNATTATWRLKSREDLLAGDIILLREGEEIPADILLINTSGETGAREVFVNNASLTGEKDPLRKTVVSGLTLNTPASNTPISANSQFTPLHGILYLAGEPNGELDDFCADLCLGEHRYRCHGSDHILLAGSVLCRGPNAIGVIFATGKDTKIQRNLSGSRRSGGSAATATKRGRLDRQLDAVAMATLFALAVFVFIGVISRLYINSANSSTSFKESGNNSVAMVTMTTILVAMASCFLLFNGLVAQTVHVTVDVLRRWQARMWKQSVDVDVMTPSVVEDCGVVDVAVVDKTGTLTKNELRAAEFVTICENNIHVYTVPQDTAQKVGADQSPMAADVHRLLLGVCLNNSAEPVVAGESVAHGNGESQMYFGTSADEVCLLDGAGRTFGYRLVGRVGSETVKLRTDVAGDDEWEICHIWKYTSSRGFMAVLLKNSANGEMVLTVKGSPARLTPLLTRTTVAKATEAVELLARTGRRVLLFAEKRYGSNDVAGWTTALSVIESDTTGMNTAAAEALYDELLFRTIEAGAGLDAVGASGADDRLHDGIVDALQAMRAKGIAVVMATGDIRLTAVSIATTVGILPKEEVIQLSLKESEEPRSAMDKRLDEILSRCHGNGGRVGLVVGRDELAVIAGDAMLSNKLRSVLLSAGLQGAVVYRATPAAKADLVRLLGTTGEAVVMAVGDGANDAAMISAADVGVAIKGGEASSAALGASDMAVAGVVDLPVTIDTGRGHWTAHRTAAMLITAMKFTVALSLLLWEVFMATGAPLYKDKMLLSMNVLYGWATIALGVVDGAHRRTPKSMPERPSRAMKTSSLDAVKMLASWWITAAVDAFAMLALSFLLFQRAVPAIPFFGDSVSSLQFGHFLLTLVWVNVRVALETDSWKVRGTVAATVATVLCVVVGPRWRHLPRGMLLLLLVAVCILTMLDKVVRALRNTTGTPRALVLQHTGKTKTA